MECFLVHVAHADNLNEHQQFNIYTTGLLEPLKTDIEVLDLEDMEMTMSLARAYTQRLAVVAKANKASALKSRCFPPPKAAMTTTTATNRL